MIKTIKTNLPKGSQMRRFASTALKTQTTEMFSAAVKEPIEITKHGKAAFVLMSEEHFRRLEGLEDAAWGELAQEAIKSGFVRGDEAMSALEALMKDKSV